MKSLAFVAAIIAGAVPLASAQSVHPAPLHESPHFGGNVYVMSAFQPVGQVARDAPWSPQELIDAKGELFKGISSEIGEFGFF